ncbi:MAG: LysR family transcriptional regulator, partial [Gammaproteobacteria bacterium]|nr:LysR family transcriptional regulator [Gammaproteobacteria bacterium]
MKHNLSLNDIEKIMRAGSIRKAAEELYITASALNRRIIAIEEFFGVKLFERLPNGVRLSTAGEIYLQHVRMQYIDLERIRGQFSDLSGVRRGHVSIASSQALLSSLLPNQIALFRQQFPEVTFSVNTRDRYKAEEALIDFSADLALVLEPVKMSHFQVLAISQQPILAVMAKTHPLAQKAILKLSDFVGHSLALPNDNFGVSHILEKALHQKMFNFESVIRSDSFEFLRHMVLHENVVTFQIGFGIPQSELALGIILLFVQV